MEPTLFTNLIKDLGRFETRFKGTHASDAPEDLVFKVKEHEPECPNCFDGLGRQVMIEKKQDIKFRTYWRIKCKFCRAFNRVNHPIS